MNSHLILIDDAKLRNLACLKCGANLALPECKKLDEVQGTIDAFCRDHEECGSLYSSNKNIVIEAKLAIAVEALKKIKFNRGSDAGTVNALNYDTARQALEEIEDET